MTSLTTNIENLNWRVKSDTKSYSYLPMLSFVRNLLLVVVLVLLPLQLARAKAFEPPKQILFFALEGNAPVSDSIQVQRLIPVPFLYFQQREFLSENLDVSFLTGGIFNQGSFTYHLPKRFYFGASGMAFLMFAGDFVQIDGNQFGGQYDFNGHIFGGTVFAGKTLLIKKRYPFDFKFSVQIQNRRFFNDPGTAGFSIPDSFWQVEPQFSMGIFPPPLPQHRLVGYYPQIIVAMEKRYDYSPWGVAGSEASEDQFFKGEFAWDIFHPLRKRITLFSRANLTMVSGADRLNALFKGRLNPIMEFGQPFLQQVASERMGKLEMGSFFATNDKKTFAIKPSALGAVYKEILVPGSRVQWAGGPKLAILGDFFKTRLSYHLDYGAIYGVNDGEWIHEVAFGLAYRFKP